MADEQKLARITERGRTLWVSGYLPIMRDQVRCYGQFEVLKPGAPEWYRVDLVRGTCHQLRKETVQTIDGPVEEIKSIVCPSCAKYRTCKHRIAIAALVLEGIAEGVDDADIRDFFNPLMAPTTHKPFPHTEPAPPQATDIMGVPLTGQRFHGYGRCACGQGGPIGWKCFKCQRTIAAEPVSSTPQIGVLNGIESDKPVAQATPSRVFPKGGVKANLPGVEW